MSTPAPDRPAVLTTSDWLPRQAEHRRRVADRTEDYLARRSRGHKHPVEDFLFTYYSHKPGRLARWHPGLGVVLTGDEATERVSWKFYRRLTAAELDRALLPATTTAVTVDTAAYADQHARTLTYVRNLLERTASRPGQFGCFGLHEWAMVYRQDPTTVRHEYLPLRLGPEGTNDVVERNRIRCSHFDAFRFFTSEATGRNELQPTRERAPELEQPGCLHANMDLYKWAYKLTPAVPSELVLDCFDLAFRIRDMDMRASPYDLSDYGYEPIRIETAEGRSAYAAAQRGFSREAQTLRTRLLSAIADVAGGATP